MQKYNYTTVDTIFSKFSRDLRGVDIHESDMIEWIGEALGFLGVSEIQKEAVAFLKVKNHSVDVPDGFQGVIQVAVYNDWKGDDDELSPCNIVSNITENTVEEVKAGCTDGKYNGIGITDCNGRLILNDDNIAYFRPKFVYHMGYGGWVNSNYYRTSFSPLRLSNHTFFNSVVCTETNETIKNLYSNCGGEYTLVGGYPKMQIRTSFKEGFIALSYLENMTDPDTGYPLIPDNILHITAITYYIKWKIAERLRWEGREGFAGEAREAEERWLKYVRQAINNSKMPTGIDQYQNIMEQSMYLIPRFRKYQGFFGKLGREEDRRFNFRR